MPDWLLSAIIGALVAFIFNASFQTRKDIIASAIKAYAAVERYRTITQTQFSILFQSSDVETGSKLPEYWNETRHESTSASAEVKVLMNTEFISLKPHLDVIEKGTDRWSSYLVLAGIEPYSTDDLVEINETMHKECDEIQQKLLGYSRPSWRFVLRRMVGIA